MLPALAPIENVWQLIKMKLRKKIFRNCQSLICTIRGEWKSLPPTLAITVVHSTNSRIFGIIKSDGDFVLR